MCPSTWALSVDTWLRPYTYRRTPNPSNASTTTPMMAKAMRLPPRGRTGGGVSTGTAGAGLPAGCCFRSGSMIVAISSLIPMAYGSR